jgi:diaminopimelate epimerase
MSVLASPLPFTKMHGLGNDFVVIDARDRAVTLSPETIARIADRHSGVGFDQLVMLEPPRSMAADVFVRFINADGSEAGACGNGSRCAVDYLLDRAGGDFLTLETVSGVLPARRNSDGLITVDMGKARLGWREIPLSHDLDTEHLALGVGQLDEATCTSMGNPHATFFVPDLNAVDLARLGPLVEHHPYFPERVNVGVAEIIGPDRMRLRVWERGSGLTLACGSGACAALVAAVRRGLTGRTAELLLERGSLTINWREDGHVLMTGPSATSFHGFIAPSLLTA